MSHFEVCLITFRNLFVLLQIFWQDQERVGTPGELWESGWKIWHGVNGLQHKWKGTFKDKEPTIYVSPQHACN